MARTNGSVRSGSNGAGYTHILKKNEVMESPHFSCFKDPNEKQRVSQLKYIVPSQMSTSFTLSQKSIILREPLEKP